MTIAALGRIVRGAVMPGLMVVAISLPACSTSAPKQTKFMQGTDVVVSAEELRIQVRALAAPFSGIMEEAGDQYLEYTDDPEEIRAALLWKINGIPAMQRALFVQDPLAALLDAWVLTAQARVHFERQLDNDAGHRGRRHALEAVRRMEDRIEELARSISATGEIDHIRKLVYEIAHATSVDETFTTRPATEAQLAKFTAEAKPGIGAAVGTLTTGVGDLWARLDVYTAFLPKQARWQAELMIVELAGGRDPGVVFDNLENFTASIDRIAATFEAAPDLVTSEREAILRALQQERIIALKTFQEELVKAYEFITRERVAAFTEGMAAEREAALAALTMERIATLDAIHEERIATMDELETIVGGLSEDAMTRLVDRIFVRLLVLIVIVGALAAVAGFFFVRRPPKQAVGS